MAISQRVQSTFPTVRVKSMHTFKRQNRRLGLALAGLFFALFLFAVVFIMLRGS
jgi:hypothetical protein